MAVQGTCSQPPRARPGAQLAPTLDFQVPPADSWYVFQHSLEGERWAQGASGARDASGLGPELGITNPPSRAP